MTCLAPSTHRGGALRVLSTLLLLAGCGAEGDSGSPGGGGGGGGNVGFGGAQDIGQFRGILEAGGIPGEETLDAGGFFAEHHSEQPPPDCGQPVCLVGMTALGRDWLRGEDQAVLQISMTTPVDPATLERRPLNLVVVVDTSGSMSIEDRIGYARQGLHALVDELEPGDRMALVSYSDGVQVWNELTDETDAATLHALIDQLVAAGGTNIHDGLQRGFQLSLAAWDIERQNRVLLVSDGLATVGETSDLGILTMAEPYFEDGIGLTTVGVGREFNVQLMRGLAERGAGSFYFLESAAAIAEVFREELDTFLTPLAFEVEVAVTAESGWQLGEAVGSRFWSGAGQTGALSLPAVFVASRTSDEPGELGRRGAGGALFVALSPTSGSIWDGQPRLASVRLRYRLPDSGELLEQTITVEAGPPASPSSPDELRLSHESMAEHYAMYNMFLGLRAATRYARSSYDCALGTLDELAARAGRWVEETGDPDIEADLLLVARFQDNLLAAGARPIDGEDLDLHCAGYDPYEPYPYDDYDHGHYHGCSAAAGPGGPAGALALLALAAALAYRRRRRAA